MKKLKLFAPLLFEESAHFILWRYMISSCPDRFTGNLGTIVIVSLAIAILLSNLFDIVSIWWTDKDNAENKTGRKIPQPLRYLVISIFFTAAFLFIAQYAQARTVLLIWLGCAYALAYVMVTHLILYLLQLEESILPEKSFFHHYDVEDDDEDDTWYSG